MTEEKLKIVQVYGHLYAGGYEYLLLKPEPIVGDSWERDNTYRFLVTPKKMEAVDRQEGKTYGIYAYARHIVTNSFTIEFIDVVNDIEIPVSEEVDYSEYNMEEEDEKELPY